MGHWYSRLAPPLRALVLACVATAAAGASAAFVLVFPEEFARERAADVPPRTRGWIPVDPQAPEIELVKPPSLDNVTVPTDIELRFLPQPPSTIDRDSLRVLYGFFDMDVTERLTGHAEVTPYGLLARNAVLPAGTHRITVEISDDRKRVGRRTFELEIAEP